MSKPHLKILVIGKTSAGKSSSINMILNLAAKVNYEDERIIAIEQQLIFTNNAPINLKCNIQSFQSKQSDVKGTASKSQTQDCNMYTVENNSHIITLVDTPGLGDTQGTQQDDKNIKTIISRIQSLIQINAILYVHRSTDIRRDFYLEYYVNSFKSMLTKECKNNFVVCFTSVNNPEKIDSKQTLNEIGFPVDKSIYFENDCLMPPSLYPDQLAIKRLRKQSALFWESNEEQYEELINMVEIFKPQETRKLLDLLVNKEAIIKMACQKQNQIKCKEFNKTNLQQLKNSIQNVQKKIQSIGPEVKQIPVVKYKQVAYTEMKQVQEHVGKKITYCYNCEGKCHNPCYLNEVYARGDYNLKNCASFSSQTVCKVCHHSISEHGHTNQICRSIAETKYRQEPYTEMQNVKDEEKAQKRIDLENETKKMNQQVDDLEKQIHKVEEEVINELQFIAVLNKRVKEVQMDSREDATVNYIDKQIEALQSNDKITKEERDALHKNFCQAKDTYLIIETQIKDANLTQGKTILNDTQLQVLNKKLAETKDEIMSSVQSSINQCQSELKSNSSSWNSNLFY